MSQGRSFGQARASILFDESLHKIVDGANYGVCINKLTARLEAELAEVQKKQYTDYPAVMAMSADPEALQKAWNIVIDKDRARELVYTYLDESECPVLGFTATTMRGHAWDDGRIRLPQTPTLGVTLHEVAHIIQCNDKGFNRLPSGKRDVHGEDFVKILDGLVRSELIQGNADA